LTNVYPNNKNNKNNNKNNKNNKVKSKPLELRSRVKILEMFLAFLLLIQPTLHTVPCGYMGCSPIILCFGSVRGCTCSARKMSFMSCRPHKTKAKKPNKSLAGGQKGSQETLSLLGPLWPLALAFDQLDDPILNGLDSTLFQKADLAIQT
jgi:hypothetical protein